MTDETTLELLLRDALTNAKVDIIDVRFPIIIRSGVNEMGHTIRYFLNYSPETQGLENKFGIGRDVFTETEILEKETITIAPWDVAVIVYK